MNFALNVKQTLAVQQLNEFINQSAYNYFYLFGHAGSGKTMTISKTIIDLLERKLIDRAYVAAPTHVALNVLESYFKTNYTADNQKVLLDKIKFMTIHKLLEFKASISNETGSKVFKSTKESKYLKHVSNRLVIIDECSMISADMLKEITKYIELYMLKVIFLGDEAQLRPVNEGKSLVFLPVPKQYPYHIVLDEIMRTKSDSIKTVSQIIRQWNPLDKSVNLTKLLLPVHNIKTKPRSFKLYHKNDDYINTTWFKYIVEKIKVNIMPVILTWRNAPAEYYNKIIRQHIHQTADLTNYKTGDCLMFNNFYISPEIGEMESVRFYTSNVIKIISMKSAKIKLIDWALVNLKPVPTKDDAVPITISTQIVSAYNTLLRKLNKFQTEFIVDSFIAEKIHNNPDDLDAHLNQCIVKTINRSELKAYGELLKSVKEHLEFFFKKYNSEEISSVLWKSFHANLIDPYAELNFGYSITTHKAQGSTFDTVLVDFDDIVQNPNVGEMQEALYTASSRAANELGFLF